MAELVYLKEKINQYYQKYSERINPVLKGLVSFLFLILIQNMFPYYQGINIVLAALVCSVVQAFLPMSFLFCTASLLIAVNLWKASVELSIVFIAVIAMCCLLFIRVDAKYGFIIFLTAVLFYLKLEYLLPVIVAMVYGIGSILPMIAGIVIYFFSTYIADVNALLTTTTDQDPGIGISRVVNLMIIDKRMLVILITFSIVVFIATLLYRMFNENAWVFTIIIGNVAMAVLLLSGRLIFELNFSIWRVFLETVLAIGVAVLFQFFKGIGDYSRVEKVTFEDDEYIYYVKAVPKIKVAQEERNVTNIRPGRNDEEEDESDLDNL
ncbi:MAG: hypothetical protein LUF92_00095 [Clostridiales bacterium]|nr:hypothetical protein [Clostridiales bacterium]